MLLALLLFFGASDARRLLHGGRRGNRCDDMAAERATELISSFESDGTTPLFCRLRAEKRFPHWTEGCTEEPTVATTTAPPTQIPTAPEQETAVLSTDEEDGGQRRLLQRTHGHGGHHGGGHRGGFDRARTQFNVNAGVISGFKNKGGCRDESSFTCFDELASDDCAYTAITTATSDDTVTLTFTSGNAETIDLVCPFEGKLKGEDCDEETIQCTRQDYAYGSDTYRFSLQCSTVEHEWTDSDGNAYPECPSGTQ